MHHLNTIKVVLELVVLVLFLVLLWHVTRKDGRQAALGLLTNKP